MFRLPCWRGHVDFCLEYKHKMIWRINSIIYFCKLTCASWLPHLRTSRSDLGWVLVFKIGLSAEMVLVAFVGYILRYSINMFLGLSLVLPLGSPLDSPNTGADMHSKFLGTPLGLYFGSEVSRCMCYCRCLMDFHKATCWVVFISCVPSYGAFITSKINSVRYFQLMELITLSLSPTWLIPTYGGMWRADEIASTESIPFTLVMN